MGIPGNKLDFWIESFTGRGLDSWTLGLKLKVLGQRWGCNKYPLKLSEIWRHGKDLFYFNVLFNVYFFLCAFYECEYALDLPSPFWNTLYVKKLWYILHLRLLGHMRYIRIYIYIYITYMWYIRYIRISKILFWMKTQK